MQLQTTHWGQSKTQGPLGGLAPNYVGPPPLMCAILLFVDHTKRIPVAGIEDTDGYSV